ncbi:family 16 glycoside hydrolase [Actinomadura sp. HBU206391]|uniref:family 16 glycoside hydrolase n=1 Tax=Actinomadura sp. HBU206391 TaxID=2731692 RepID=UPI00164F688B|nr:family 16 glycoside hydrolase [Actinomadura sp. HBU206391]MBC6457233.1 DUF1080 domain-containing protein [Actinomadura sp. HBU206391]
MKPFSSLHERWATPTRGATLRGGGPGRRRWWLRPRVGCPAVLALAGLLGILVPALLPDSGDGVLHRWRDGTTHGPWRAVFDGEGISGVRDGVIVLRPKPAVQPAETHACLVVSRKTYHDMDLSIRFRTTAQLRQPQPNPWEVAWVVWAYTDEHHFYYLTLKPNGWELGKRDPAYPGGQRFLATGDPEFPVDRWYQVKISQRGATMTVRIKDRELTVHADEERPYLSGAVGVYTEDAETEFRSIKVSPR